MESNPNFSAIAQGDLFVIRWYRPTVESVARLGELLTQQHQRAGQRLFYIALVPGDADKLDDETNAALLDAIRETAPLIETIRIVILGRGFKTTLMRSAMAAMTLVSGLAGYPFHVDKSLRAALDKYVAHTGRPAAPLLEHFVREGLLTAAEIDNQG